ncbi:MAG: 50S ribosomal protein L24 [Methylomonas sp.]|jgi:large subunit ribosomal protein L24
MNKIKQGDEVVVIVGKDKGKQGKVEKILDNNKLIVNGINKVKKHQKANPNVGVSGGITEKEMPIDISNVALFNPKTKKADRVGFRIINDKKVRFFKSTNDIVGL